jgi:hypothetical protein
MMKQIVVVALIASYLCTFGSRDKLFEGEISDSQCGFNVHSLKRSHAEMLKTGYMGKNAEECAQNCVRGRGGEFVFVTSDKKSAYKIDSQEAVEPFAGRRVQIQGIVVDGRIHMSSIKSL